MANPLPDPYTLVGQQLARFQRRLSAQGETLSVHMERQYGTKWRSESLSHVHRVRTALVSGMTDFLIEAGLLNLERVSLSLVTDPLAHTVEHLAGIPYRGADYVTTHSMIYAKFLACQNPHLKGIFVDSPNIRLEPAEPSGRQRGRYLIDFSQLDVEVRRNSGIGLDHDLDAPEAVEALLREHLEAALRFFEGMARAGLEKVQRLAGDSLQALGVRIDLPETPFPVFHLDEAIAQHGPTDIEAKLGAACASQCFFVVGLLRENYDLIYPYLERSGERRPLSAFTSRQVYNYDLVVKGRHLDGRESPAKEVLSGGLREWLPEAIVARLLDNGVIPVPRHGGGAQPQRLDTIGCQWRRC